MNGRQVLRVVLALLAILSMPGCWPFSITPPPRETPAQNGDQLLSAGMTYPQMAGSGSLPSSALASSTLQSAAVQRANITSLVSASGSVVSQRSWTLTFRSAGRVKEVNVFPGSVVKKGQVLAEIDTADLQIQLEKAKVALAAAQIKLNTVQQGARPEAVAAAEVQVRAAQLRLSSLTTGPRQEDIVIAQAAVDSAQASLDRTMVPFTDAEITAQEAAVLAAQAGVQAAQINLYNAQHADPKALRDAQMAYEQAKNSLNGVYLSRDAACAQNGKDSYECQRSRSAAAVAEIGLRKVQSDLADLRAGGNPQKIAQAQASLASASAALESGEKKLAEMKAGPSAGDVMKAQAALTEAQQNLSLRATPHTQEEVAMQVASVDQAEAALALVSNPYTEWDLQTAQLDLHSAQVAVDQAQYNLDNAALISPLDGVVSNVGYSPGAMSSGGGATTGGAGGAGITVVDTKNIRLDVAVEAADLARVSVGQPAKVTFEGASPQEHEATILAISPSGETRSGITTFRASVAMSQMPESVKIGMRGTAVIIAAERKNVLAVPSKAIRTVEKEKLVDVLDRATGTTAPRTITTGISNEMLMEVTGGLTEGEEIIVPAPVSVNANGSNSPLPTNGTPAAATTPARTPTVTPTARP